MNRFTKALPVFVAALLFVAAPAVAGGAVVGHKAPDFSLVDHAGNTHKLSDYAGKIVVLEWTNPQCPFVQRHYSEGNMTMVDTAAKFAGDEVVWLAVDSSKFVTAESASAWAKEKGMAHPTLLDASGEVGRMYGAKTTPHMFVVGTDGTLIYNGAIDDDKTGKASDPTNYVAAAVSAAMHGEAVAQGTTKPYGCSVKYAEMKEKPAMSSSR